MENNNLPGKKHKKKKKGLILFAVESFVLFMSIAFLFVASKITDNVQRVHIDDQNIVINTKEEETETVETPTEEEAEIETAVQETKEVTYRNIALFGVDSREMQLSNGTRTDTIIIASINEVTKEVRLVSVFRDTYLNIGNDSFNKANAAYAYGGPEQAINMLNMNLDLDITDYVTIGFRGLIDTIDAIGGIKINVETNEIEHLNNYQICMADEMSKSYTPVTEPGVQVLDGMQATAYCRIRYTAGNDFKRTERQRTVITQIVEKAKTLPVSDLNAVLDSVLPKVSTSFTINEMVSVLSELARYSIVETEGFPFETNRTTGTIGKRGSCVIADSLEENVVLLHEFLFETQNYVPSEAVIRYSQIIQDDTAPYL